MGDNRRINIKAIVLGVLTDIGGSLLIGFIWSLMVFIILSIKGMPQSEIDSYFYSPIFLIQGSIIGFGFTVLGGFVAGRVSKSYEVLHGGIVGFIGIFLGLPFWASFPLWCNIISLLGSVPFGMLGGRIAEFTHKK